MSEEQEYKRKKSSSLKIGVFCLLITPFSIATFLNLCFQISLKSEVSKKLVAKPIAELYQDFSIVQFLMDITPTMNIGKQVELSILFGLMLIIIPPITALANFNKIWDINIKIDKIEQKAKDAILQRELERKLMDQDH